MNYKNRMACKNILVTDQCYIKDWDFQKGVENSIGESFEQIALVSNKMRSRWYNVVRYTLYFYYPFKIFLNRKKYNRILCWQAFYGVVLAYYHILFNVKPINEIAITHLIYNPKKSFIGKIYKKWLTKVLKSGYITCYIGGSKTHRKYLIEQFGIPKDKIHFVPYCKEDETKKTITDVNPIGQDFILGVGRSNRDWHWIIDAFSKSKRYLVIICDDLRVDQATLPNNVKIINDVEGDDMLAYMKHCYCQVCSFKNPQVASGEMVYVQGACFSKPFVVTGPCCITDDYVINGVTGVVVDKDKDKINEAVERLFTDKSYYKEMCKNSRLVYESEYDLFQYGKKVGSCILKSKH
ncbi:MAG: glycosyltransferase family 4 protein [Bacteroidales bacterium]|nr:glycosyltransferase family 4 protein [Bacteroidales bacterium]